MKFITSNQTLARGVSAVQNAVGSAISNPIVENIHISCENGKLVFLATNLNLTIRCEGEANVEENGEIVLPSKVIFNVVRDLPQGDVSMEVKNEIVRIKCGEFSAKIKGQPGELFPPFVVVDEGDLITMKVLQIKDIIRKTIISSSSEKSRYELDGVKFEIKENEMKCIATDGRRLSFYAYNSDDIPDKEISALVPTKTLHEVINSLPDDGDVQIRFSERKIQFFCGDTTIISNLLVDNFPQYDRIIPPEGQNKIRFKRTDFASAVRRAANLASITTNMIIVKINKNCIEFNGEREEVGGEGHDMITAEYDGEPMEVRYNHKFLSDFFRVQDEETIELDISDQKRPGIFSGKENKNFKYVLMTMRPPDSTEKSDE
jgi:DNA polymerase III subunit beta